MFRTNRFYSSDNRKGVASMIDSWLCEPQLLDQPSVSRRRATSWIHAGLSNEVRTFLMALLLKRWVRSYKGCQEQAATSAWLKIQVRYGCRGEAGWPLQVYYSILTWAFECFRRRHYCQHEGQYQNGFHNLKILSHTRLLSEDRSFSPSCHSFCGSSRYVVVQEMGAWTPSP